MVPQHGPLSLHTMLEGPWLPKTAFPTPMVRPLDESQGSSPLQGHGSWVVCEVALIRLNPIRVKLATSYANMHAKVYMCHDGCNWDVIELDEDNTVLILETPNSEKERLVCCFVIFFPSDLFSALGTCKSDCFGGNLCDETRAGGLFPLATYSRHHRLRSKGSQVQPVACRHPLVFLYYIGVYSIYSSKMIRNFLAVLNFNRLFFKLNRFICN